VDNVPPELVTREVFWNIPPLGRVAFYAMAVLAVAVFAYGVWRQIERVWRAKPVDVSWSRIRSSTWRKLTALVLNRTVARRSPLVGWMHRSIMWGFLTLFIGTLIVALEYDVFQVLLGRRNGFWYGRFFLAFELILDSMGALFLAGLLFALARQSRLRFLSASLLAIGLTGFIVEGMRLAATASQLGYSPGWSPIGYLFAQPWLGVSPDSIRPWHAGLWLFHAALSLGWVALLPHVAGVKHILTAGINVLLEDLRPRGRLAVLDVETAFEKELPLGLGHLSDLTRKDALDLISCTECGRCEAHCPANGSGKLLSPRAIVTKLRDVRPSDTRPIMGTAITAEEIWACTTCMACVEVCPVSIDPLSKILELRRNEP
jgi:ferredoxin